jgi:hypothetical protein
MAKDKSNLIEIRCPCCESILKIDPELKSVISFEEHQKPRSIADMETAVQKFKGEEARRSEAFDKSFAEHKTHQKVLERKFDELFKQAKENPDAPAPRKPFDYE